MAWSTARPPPFFFFSCLCSLLLLPLLALLPDAVQSPVWLEPASLESVRLRCSRLCSAQGALFCAAPAAALLWALQAAAGPNAFEGQFFCVTPPKLRGGERKSLSVGHRVGRCVGHRDSPCVVFVGMSPFAS
ncbi:unnamed protein product [Prorocentrum cordatum]|uniref:Secreted protein n=1 Tax=Prorocentrum cordatum TaxID=2364126 RepID=A0ABN9PD88_9DINO|nr:unnamed protein product [Polarella glacialis]